MAETPHLKVGDYIHLNFVKINSFLSAEGVLSENLFVTDSVEFLENILFQIHLQRQYSAAVELEIFNERRRESPEIGKLTTGAQDKRSKKHHKALQKGRDNELRMNESFMKERMGTPVLFGDIIQLFHVKSKKYITLAPSDLARDERENMSLYLNPEGNSNSWFQILPRYKIDREGDRIPAVTEVYFRCSQRSNEFLHCADRDPPPGLNREVNIAMGTPTSWRAQLFRDSKEIVENKSVLCGDQVYFKDPEHETFLAYREEEQILKPVKDIDLDAAVKGDNNELSTFSSTSLTKDKYLPLAGSLVLQGSHGLNISAIWTVERLEITEGGSFAWRTDFIRLRHYISGKYLSNNEQGHWLLVSIPDNTCSLNIVSLSNNNPHKLERSSPVLISRGRHFLCREGMNLKHKTFAVKSVHHQSHALNLRMEMYMENPDDVPTRIDGLLQPMDLFACSSIKAYLYYFANITNVPNSGYFAPNSENIWPRTEIQNLNIFREVLQLIVTYIAGEAIIFHDEDEENQVVKDSLEKYEELLRRGRRQALLRELGVLHNILIMLNTLVPVTLCRQRAATAQIQVNQTAYATVEAIISDFLALILHLVDDNHDNQMAVADNLLVILSHVTSDKKASAIVQSMLRDNTVLQETKIGKHEIGTFAERMHDREMNSKYVHMLTSCCSCQGMPVSSNQNLVEQFIFGQNKDLLISISSDEEFVDKQVFDRSFASPIYNNILQRLIHNAGQGSSDITSKILGQAIAMRGCPRIMFNWSIFSSDSVYDPRNLYGENPVALSAVVQMRPSTVVMSKGDVRTARENVLEFLKAQLLLASEMCLGRNYTVMYEIEYQYPFDNLLGIYLGTKDEELRYSVLMLIFRLFIDRDPFHENHLPQLSRKWADVQKMDGKPQIRSLNNDKKYYFSVVQHVISHALNFYTKRAFGKSLLGISQILCKLVNYSAYGNLEAIEDVIECIHKVLDRKGVEIKKLEDKKLSRRLSTTKSSKIANQKSRGTLIRRLSTRDEAETTEEKVEEEIWEKSVLEFLEDINVTFFILFLVFISLAIAVVQMYVIPRPDDDDKEYKHGEIDSILFGVDIGIYIIFVVEFCVRFYCHGRVRGSFGSFWSDAFNWLDFIVIILDTILIIFLFFLEELAIMQDAGSFTRALRILRIFKVVRALRLVRRMMNFVESVGVKFKPPERYLITPSIDRQTMVQFLQVISSIQNTIDDNNFSNFLMAFKVHEDDEDYEILKCFEEFMGKNKALSVSSFEKDSIYLDLIMYNDFDLTQASLNVLMRHHTGLHILLENVSGAQILSTSKQEKLFDRVSEYLQKLSKEIDAFPVWMKLDTEEKRDSLARTKHSIRELMYMVRKRRTILELFERYEPDTMIQNMLRNTNCYGICLKALHLIEKIRVLKSQQTIKSEVIESLTDMLKEVSELLEWFIISNPTNQAIAFEDLPFFFETIDDNIDAHRMFKAIFINNDILMKKCAKHYIHDFVKLVMNNGKYPRYLILLSNCTSAGEKNVLEKQFEVILQIANPEWTDKILHYLCSVKDQEYATKSKSMQPLLSVKDITEEQLPDDLAYHLELVKAMTGCTIGRYNITSVEAKVQSLWKYSHVVDAMLDSKSLLLVRIYLGYFFYHAMIEVEMKLPTLHMAQCVWSLLYTFPTVFSESRDMLRQVEKDGWDAPTSHRQLIEYMIVCVMITKGFFQFYFSRSAIRSDAGGELGGGIEKVKIREDEVDALIRTLFTKVKDIYELQSPLILLEYRNYLFEALVALNQACKLPIVSTVERYEEDVDSGGNDVNDTRRNKISNNFTTFIEEITNEEGLREILDAENDAIIDKIESIPKLTDISDSDVRYEALIGKLINHMDQCIKIKKIDGEDIRFMDEEACASSTWIIKLFRRMIERRWGMTIDERDDDGGEEQDIASAEIVALFNTLGVTELCLKLISPGIDRALQVEALNLSVALLFKEGGAFDVQETIFAYLNNGQSQLFFRQCHEIITELIDFHKWNQVVILEDEEEPNLPDEIIIVRFLQLTCEGHYGPNQDIMREQVNNHNTFNLLDDFIYYMQALDPIPCRTSTFACLKVAATVLEVIQGPCEGNQDYFALNTELIESLNRKMRVQPRNDCDEDDELEMKKTCIDIFQALLEGQGRKVAVYERVLSVIHIDIIEMMSTPPKPIIRNKREIPVEQSEEEITLETESMVLLNMLLAFKPSMADELMNKPAPSSEATDADSKKSSTTASIEIVWRGELQQRFFHIPNICGHISETSKANFVEYVERDSQESKLLGLLDFAEQVYSEITHQEWLDSKGYSIYFNPGNLSFLTILNFFIGVAINFLMLAFYSTEDYIEYPTDDAYEIPADCGYSGRKGSGECGDDDELTGDWAELRPGGYFFNFQRSSNPLSFYYNPNEMIMVLTWIYIGIAVLILLMNMVIRSPVLLNQLMHEHNNIFIAIWYTALDFPLVYYSFYLGLALGAILADLKGLLTFLLLDILTKDDTTKAVIIAVIYPWKQLLIAATIMFTIQYTTALYVFFFFATDEDLWREHICKTVWDCFKIHLFMGIGGDIGDYHSSIYIGKRYMLDFLYFILQFIMLNIVKGITIDTFVELRMLNMERVHETTNFCFICGIENITFDRGIGRGAFRKHIQCDHHMWDYVRFMIYVWEQDMDDDDGLEQYVRRCVDSRDLSWFPINKSMDLVTDDNEMNEKDALMKHVEDSLIHFEQEVNTTIVSLLSNFFSTAMSIQESIPAKPEPSVNLNEASVATIANGVIDPLQIDADGIDDTNVVKARISKIVGLMELLSVDDASSITVRMVSAGGQMLFLGKTLSSGPEGSTVEFSSKHTLSVHQGKEIKHGEFIQIQVLVTMPSPSLEDGDFYRFIASAEIAMEDLLEASGSHVDVTLHLNGSTFVVYVSSLASASLLKK